MGGWVKHSEVPDPASLADWAESPDVAADPTRVPMVGPEDRAASPRYIDLEAYDAYLESDDWKRRRVKVLERAGGRCEGCLSCPATDVHHLTYRNLFAEFAFQLVALCRKCHERVHQSTAGEGRE